MNITRLILSDYRYQVGLVIFIVVIGIGIRGYATRHVQSTDNATVQCDLVDVVSEVNGIIKEIVFEDDQWVNGSETIITIEDALFSAELNRAKASLEIRKSNYKESLNDLSLIRIDLESALVRAESELASAKAMFSSTEAAIEEVENEIKSSISELSYLEENYLNETKLYKNNMISQNHYRNSKRLFKSKRASHAALLSRALRLEKIKDAEMTKVVSARKSLDALQNSQAGMINNAEVRANTAKSAVAVAQAEYDLASLNLERTRIKAKRAGHVTNRRTSSGDYIAIGQPIASIVSCQENPWIQANFKETQIGRMTQGQKVEFTIDTYPGVTFEGVLQSISSGSGSTFSVLPPENASGNFTKVTKRMPVKISINNANGATFRVGASASVNVYTNSSL